MTGFATAQRSRLRVGAVDDPAEREAERVAEAVVGLTPSVPLSSPPSNPPPGEGEAGREVGVGAPLSRLGVRGGQGEGKGVRSLEGGPGTGDGQPLSPSQRAYFEPHFGDLSRVRLHTGGAAAEAARGVAARAFTVGQDIAFGAGEYRPDTRDGKKLLAHELTHTVQPGGNVLRRTPLSTFRTQLEAISPDHARIIAALFAHPRFAPIVTFLNGCPRGAIDFFVRPITVRVAGRTVQRFGGFSPSSSSGSPSEMEVNPAHPLHVANPIELADTVVHELVHALLSLRSTCESRANPWPLPAGVFDVPSDPELAAARSGGIGNRVRQRPVAAALSTAGVTTTSGRNLRDYLEDSYGPGASNPQGEYVDLNIAGNELVTGILRDLMTAVPGVGRETVSFDNVELARAAALLSTRTWLNATQFAYSKRLFKNQVATKRQVDPATYTDREYQISALQVVEFADSRRFDANTGNGWGPIGPVWVCHKRSRFSGQDLRTIVTGVAGRPPGGAVAYTVVQHT